MSIASRITAMTEHIDDIYDAVELTGVDTTGVNKNLVNVPNTLKDGFVDIINNGVDTLYENFPKVAQTGEEPTLNGVYEAPMRVELNGNTEQTTYTGKNFAIITPKDISQYGLTITYDSNTGKISIKGKANTTSGIGVTAPQNLNVPSGEYTLSTNKALPCLINYVVTDTQNTNRAFRIPAGSTNATVTIPYDGISSGLFVAVENNVDYDLEFYLQLESGSTVTSYEPYVGGTASPNPDYPQDIRVVTGDNTINIHGKNLANYDNNTNLENKYLNASGVFESAIYTYVNETIKANSNKITISFNNSVGQGYVRIGEYKEDGTFIKRNLLSMTPTTLTLDSNTSYLIYSIDKNSDNYFEKLQIEENSTATEYQPYQETTYPLNLGTTEICKIGDYQDYIYKNNGKWYLHKETEKIVLDGTQSSSSVNTSSTNTTRVQYNHYADGGAGNAGYSNLLTFQRNWSADIEGFCFDTSNGGFWIRINKATIGTTASEVNTYLSNNNLICYIPLATPTYTEITDTDLIEQLEDLKTAKSVEGQTNITQTNEELPFILDVSGLKKD